MERETDKRDFRPEAVSTKYLELAAIVQDYILEKADTIPFCSGCKRIGDSERKNWYTVSDKIKLHASLEEAQNKGDIDEANLIVKKFLEDQGCTGELSHTLCADCLKRFYPEQAKEIFGEKKGII